MSDAAQILAAHVYDDETYTCMCRLNDRDMTSREMSHGEWAAHVLAVLSETHAVVELPEPDVDSPLVATYSWGHSSRRGQNVVTLPDGVPVAPGEAEEYGAELLAAARHARVAEGGGSRG